jgi:hypothetical protein
MKGGRRRRGVGSARPLLRAVGREGGGGEEGEGGRRGRVKRAQKEENDSKNF